MPLRVLKRGEKYRLIESTGRRLARAKHGTGKPMDGGGHTDRKIALRQAEHINRDLK